MNIKVLSLVALAAGLALPVAAEEAAAPVPAQSVESFESWTVECATVTPEGGKTERMCEAAQTYKNQKSGNEVARVAFALAADAEGEAKTMRLALRNLVDMSFAAKPEILLGDAAFLTGEVQRCLGNACYTTFAITDEEIGKMEAAGDLKLRFPISNGSLFQIGMSSKGLKDALAVLRARVAE